MASKLCVALGLAAFLSPLQVAAQAGSFFVLAGGPPLVSERVDPILAPGVNGSNHVHDIFGANRFSANWDYATAQTSTCTNMGPKIDHSNYWYPALYFKNGDNYIKTKTDMSVYYHFDTKDNGPRKAFPKGFKMISGNAMLRHDDTLTDFSTRSIRWICHQTSGSKFDAPGIFPKGITNCNGVFGLSGEIWFPFCHNGQELDPANPTAHMSFGTHTDANGNVDTSNQSGGKCPTSHPTPLPQLFMEFHHDISDLPAWDANTNPWVLAPGDPTGYSMHADFINGWEDGFADQIAVDPNDPTKTKCFTGEQGADKCFEMYKGDCKMDSVVNEEVQNPQGALPGCNPIQSGPQDATIQTNCAGYQAPGGGNTPVKTPQTTATAATAAPSVASSAAAAPSSSNPPTGTTPTSPSSGNIPSTVTVGGAAWSYQGCWSDLTPDRSIRTLGNWGRGGTPQDCASNCAASGFSIAGVEYGSQCFCANQITKTQSKKLDDSQCNMSCAGSSQSCGGNGALQIYAKSGTTVSKRSDIHRHIRDFSHV